jgi:hypothetical protein
VKLSRACRQGVKIDAIGGLRVEHTGRASGWARRRLSAVVFAVILFLPSR